MFTFTNGGKQVSIFVPFTTVSTSANTFEYNLQSPQNTDPAFNTLKNLGNQASTGLPLSAFNFLNGIQWGNFYSFPDSKTPTKTNLVSAWVYVIPGFTTTSA